MAAWEDRLCISLSVILFILLEGINCYCIYFPWTRNPIILLSKLILLTIIHIFYILAAFSYLVCIFTDPGIVPDTFNDLFSLDEDSGKINSKGMVPLHAQPRWCHLCGKVKPVRAHHCSQCKRCVLKMDHHCPWMGQCIGHWNHGHFVRFCVYVTSCLFFSEFAVVVWFVERFKYQDYGRLETNAKFYLLLFTGVVSLGLLGFVGALTAYHMYAIYINRTTLEAMEENGFKRQLRGEFLRNYRFPYTLEDPFDNISQTLGRNPFLWALPITPVLSEGTCFPVHSNSLFEGQWPVRFKELEDLEKATTSFGAAESEEHRRRIRKDSEGYIIPQRLFPEFYTESMKSLSDPHLISDTIKRKTSL